MNYLSSDIRHLLTLHYKPKTLNSSLQFFKVWEENLLQRQSAILESYNKQPISKQHHYNMPDINIDEVLRNQLIKREADLRRRQLDLLRRQAELSQVELNVKQRQQLLQTEKQLRF